MNLKRPPVYILRLGIKKSFNLQVDKNNNKNDYNSYNNIIFIAKLSIQLLIYVVIPSQQYYVHLYFIYFLLIFARSRVKGSLGIPLSSQRWSGDRFDIWVRVFFLTLSHVTPLCHPHNIIPRTPRRSHSRRHNVFYIIIIIVISPCVYFSNFFSSFFISLIIRRSHGMNIRRCLAAAV